MMAIVLISLPALAQKDTTFTRYKNLPLKANRMFDLKTTEGTWTSVDISPDGKTMAFISRVGGAYKLHLMDLASSAITALTDTASDESPSFSPNGRLVLYATVLQGREALMTTTLDGRIKARLSGQSGDIREPDWGPFVR